MQFVVSSEFMRRLVEAADLRGLTPTVYCRRAVAAFVSADLGIPFADMTAQGAHPLGHGHGTFDPGTGFGPWVATPYSGDNPGDLVS